MKFKNNLTSYIVLLLSAAILTSCTNPPSDTESGMGIGRPAPKFKLPDLNGKEISLDQYKGKIVMLDFWATWCNPCRETMPLVEKLQKEYTNELVILAVNLQDTRDVVRNYVLRQNIASTVLLDESGKVGETYGITSIPMQVLLDKQGVVRHVQMGFHPRMLGQLRLEIQKLR